MSAICAKLSCSAVVSSASIGSASSCKNVSGVSAGRGRSEPLAPRIGVIVRRGVDMGGGQGRSA